MSANSLRGEAIGGWEVEPLTSGRGIAQADSFLNSLGDSHGSGRS